MNVYSSLNAGDLLYRSKGIVEHVGVYLNRGRVLHIRPGSGAVAVSFDEYSEGKAVSVKRLKERPSEGFEKRILEIIESGASYRLFSNNCEHIAHYIAAGERVSPQLQAAVGFGLVGGLLAAKGNASNFLLGVGMFGMGALLLSNAGRRYDFVLGR